MEVPGDGLEYIPLEAPAERLWGLPRTWIQMCTNDEAVLRRGMLCQGVEVKVDVVRRWPHAFCLKAPSAQEGVRGRQADTGRLGLGGRVNMVGLGGIAVPEY